MNQYSEPPQSPLFHAANAGRYDRQALIEHYQCLMECRLVVMIDHIFDYSITLFEELVYDSNPSTDLHLMIHSLGGDGEAAVRLVRSAQARCRELTVIIPDQAKSAATLLALGAHRIIMGPAGDLGPTDSQLRIGEDFVAAKDIIAAVDNATADVQRSPATYPIHATLLGGLDAIIVQQARSALARSGDLLHESLKSLPTRDGSAIDTLASSLREPLIDRPQSHAALFSADDASKAGLPVEKADLNSDSWKMLWRLWTKYFVLGGSKAIYESARASQILNRQEP